MATKSQRVTAYLQQFEAMRAEKTEHDVKYQLVSDYILPRRDFSVTQRPNQIRPHRVTSSVATSCNTRMAAMLLTYAIDTSRPFLTPNVKRGLAMAGRPTDLDDDSINYLGGVQSTIFDALLRPKANFLAVFGAMLQEFCAFGPGVVFTGRRRGFGPIFTGRSAASCWWAINEDQEIDTLYHKFLLPLYRVFERWPEAAKRAWPEFTPEKRGEQVLVPILQCCQPRPGGKVGAVPMAKPWELTTICEDKDIILDETGYDSFPYSVYRNGPMPGNAYCEGNGCRVLPDVMVLNHLMQAVENSASQKAQPAIAVPARMFGKRVDRRPGAFNTYNPQGLGLARADQAIIKLDMTGDPSEAIAVAKDLIDNIREGYMWDVFQLREAGDMTATEANARLDLNKRGAASVVVDLGAPLSRQGDRALEILIEEGAIPPAPSMVARANVDWEYNGPLQIAQLQGNVQNMLQLINARGLVFQQDPASAQVIDLETALLVIHAGLGAPSGTRNSHAKVEAFRAAQAHAAQQQADAQKLAVVAKAANDGGAGARNALGAISDYAGAGQGAPAAGGATFAPAAPLAQPVAA